ncbi:MAG TPA: APC family permease [Streptosporangiaceae bacterium]|jgi:amino acid transporter|nr:APC family permease [Streptosporangiaceae bacterium]
MATADFAVQPVEEQADKGLKSGALGLVSSVVIATASVAPAYSLAATLGFVVAVIGLASPVVCIVAFIPMLFASIGYNELNKADPDCGTTFTWATRAFGPKTGWAGGWGILAADILVMASLAQVAGQYMFLLFNAQGIGHNPASSWVLLVGVVWIIVMTAICYVGIEVSANFQKALLGIELFMLIVLSVTALIKVGTGHHPASSIDVSASWFNPFHASFSPFITGMVLFLFIYWGWDTAVSINEETADRAKTPGRSAIISTILLLVIYLLVTTSVQSFAGIGTTGIGLGNGNNAGDVLSVMGAAVFGSSGFGTFLTRLLILMVLSSAAASTQTTILPTARTTLSMAVYKAIPRSFAKVHPRYLTPTVSTLFMGGVSIALYLIMNYISHGNAISDAVTCCGIWIAFYYGLTAFTCVWYYRRTLTENARNLWMRGILPGLGGLILYFAGGWSLWQDYDVATENSYTMFTVPGLHWQVGGVFVIAVLSALGGLLWFVWLRIAQPAFFRKETLTRSTPTLVPDPD